MPSPKILVLAASMRPGSFNNRLAALVTKELVLAEADVTRIALIDYPLPLLDADAETRAPDSAIKLDRQFAAHQGIFIATPEYTASVTPILKNAIDWISRAREGRPDYAAFQDRVFALGSASAAVQGGIRALMALRQILELGCGALVIPEQINVGSAEAAFDDMDNLRNEALATALKAMVRRLVDLASTMPLGRG